MPRAALLLAPLLLVSPAQAQAPAAPACTLPTGPLPTRSRAVFVLDTSGSMRGIGDGRADIFERVKGRINAYVRQAQPDRVDLLTFDAGLRSRQSFDLPAGSARWNGALGALKADGQSTHLYRSVQAALAPLDGAEEYLTTVFVLTDGIDNDPARPYTPAQALAAFQGRGPLDRLHYVALGADIPPAARRALAGSDYADGLTVPVGQVPDLRGAGLEGGVVTVTDAARVPVPFLSGTTVVLAAPDDARLALVSPQVQSGAVQLRTAGPLPYGSAALLCAAPDLAVPGAVAARSRRVLLRLNLLGTLPLRWLNPGADRALVAGEAVTLRYRAAPGLTLDDPHQDAGGGAGQGILRLSGLPAGLSGEVRRLRGAREFEIRLVNVGLSAGTVATPTLILPGGAATALPGVRALFGGRVSSAGSASASFPPRQTSLEGQARLPRRLVWGLVGLVALGLLGALLLRRVRFGRAALPTRRRAARTSQVSAGVGTAVPSVEGIEYSAERLLSLVSPDGDVTGVATPLDGPFDLGHLARVPHLSGLRLEQERHGLKCTQIPPDLEVSQGARLLRAGDVVRPGTLLGVAVAPRARAPQVPLGSLAGLGLPLTLRCQGLTLHVVGPYGDHALALEPGLTDLGAVLDVPALHGLRVSVSGGAGGGRVLLVEVPEGITLHRPGEPAAVSSGTYLPAALTLELPER